MSNEFLSHITDALKNKGAPTHCPGCKRRIVNLSDVGSVGLWSDQTDTPTIGANNLHVICRRYVKSIGKETFIKRVERRIRANILHYTLNFVLPTGASDPHAYTPMNKKYVARIGSDKRDPWIKDDKQWFAAHSNRTHRVRSIQSEEREQMIKAIGKDNAAQWLKAQIVVVVQLAPGKRTRQPVTPEKPLSAPYNIDWWNKSDERAMRLISDHPIYHKEGRT